MIPGRGLRCMLDSNFMCFRREICFPATNLIHEVCLGTHFRPFLRKTEWLAKNSSVRHSTKARKECLLADSLERTTFYLLLQRMTLVTIFHGRSYVRG